MKTYLIYMRRGNSTDVTDFKKVTIQGKDRSKAIRIAEAMNPGFKAESAIGI